MRISRSEPGYALSAAIHFGLLAAMLVAFSQQQKFDDAQESVPIETITENQFSQIMKGEKQAKEPTTKPRVDRVADVSEPKPTPPSPEVKRDIPTPPPPLKRLPDPSEAEAQPATPTPPAPKPPPAPTPAPTPPARPAPPPPAPKPPQQESRPEPEQDDAEPVKPPPRPKPPEKTPPKPDVAPPVKPVEKPTPKPPEKAVEKPPEKPAPKPPELDEVAKLLAETKDKPAPNPAPAQKPKSGAESHETRPTPDLAAISRLLSAEAPQAKMATGRELNHVASVGAPNATAQHMSPSMSDSLNGLLQAQYKACWNYIALSSGPKYIARIHVTYLPDGSLGTTPALLNPPSDPAARSLADSAMRAVRRCNPMKIPAQYLPYYQQWKDWVVGFDPDVMN